MNSDFYKILKQDCETYATEAGKILSTYQDNITIVNQKDSVDIATNADIAAEKYIIDAITKKYPDHGIYSEEAGKSHADAKYVWIIDPLDGTKEYVRGLSEYNCLIAVEEDKKIVASAIQRNGVNDLYSASTGSGTRLNGKKIKVSTQNDLAKSFIGFHVPKSDQEKEVIDKEMKALDSLVRVAYRIRPGWDDSEYCAWVARGVLEAHVVSANVNFWYDIAPGIHVVLEAGGRVTNWEGKEIVNHDLSRGVLLSNGVIHDKILELL